MRYLLDRWRGIGTRLYLALAFAVLLTLVSSGVGVFYFERSGDLNYEAEQQTVPVLEAAWETAREVERLQTLGLETVSGTGAPSPEFQKEAVGQSLDKLNGSLSLVGSVPELFEGASRANEGSFALASVIDALAENRADTQAADAQVVRLQEIMATIPPESAKSVEGLRLLEQALQARDSAELEGMLEEFRALTASGLEQPVVDVGGGAEGVFTVRRLQLALADQRADLIGLFEESSAALETATSTLLEQTQAYSTETLGQAVQSFDEGRVLLAVISIVSVIAATIAAWFWVGNAVVRRLSSLSARMRTMAGGDLETPVPEVGRDEIGQLADALEHFRQQALEVQRLNLVEQLYGELREANAELQRMQARLVAQEKLAALGELVSGVAHEISNPLNFVKNFSEGSLDLYQELAEMLDNYRDRMSDDDASLLDDLTGEITDSLNRVSYNGGRALAIVERMRSLSVESGTPALTEVNPVLRQAAQQGCETFMTEWEDFNVELVFDLDPTVGETMLVEREFGEAVVNLVSNACYAMYQKQLDQVSEDGEQARAGVDEDGAVEREHARVYAPVLTVSSHVVDDVIEVRVRDNGPGIGDDVVGRIFNPFFTTREGTLGAGLGLPIAADVARRMGGDLVVDTVFGEYAEFTMHVPVAVPVGEEMDDEGDDGATESVASEVSQPRESANGAVTENGAPQDTAGDKAVEDPAVS